MVVVRIEPRRSGAFRGLGPGLLAVFTFRLSWGGGGIAASLREERRTGRSVVLGRTI